MKRFMYAGGEFITDDATADALMDYANVLGIVDSADVVRLPGIDSEGGRQQIQMLIGPASQLLAMSTDGDDIDLDGGEAAARLRSLAAERLPTSFDVAEPGPRPAETDAESTSH
jgi:hypothetical protein